MLWINLWTGCLQSDRLTDGPVDTWGMVWRQAHLIPSAPQVVQPLAHILHRCSSRFPTCGWGELYTSSTAPTTTTSLKM